MVEVFCLFYPLWWKKILLLHQGCVHGATSILLAFCEACKAPAWVVILLLLQYYCLYTRNRGKAPSSLYNSSQRCRDFTLMYLTNSLLCLDLRVFVLLPSFRQQLVEGTCGVLAVVCAALPLTRTDKYLHIVSYICDRQYTFYICI